jgi:hypothetical protein
VGPRLDFSFMKLDIVDKDMICQLEEDSGFAWRMGVEKEKGCLFNHGAALLTCPLIEIEPTFCLLPDTPSRSSK